MPLGRRTCVWTVPSGMTICLGALCADDDGKAARAVVFAADQMETLALGPTIETPVATSKLVQLTPHVIGGLTGWGIPARQFVSDIAKTAAGLEAPLAPEQFARAVASRYQQDRSLLMERAVFAARGISSAGLYGGTNKDTAPHVAAGIDREAKDWTPGFELLLGVADKTDGAHLFGIGNPGVVYPYNPDGYAALGMGALVARLAMQEFQHSPSRSLKETIYTAYVATRRAEVTQSVGLGVDVAILTVNGIRRLGSDDISTLENLRTESEKAYRSKLFGEIAGLTLKTLATT